MGKHGVNPHELTGKLLQPDDWDKLLDERDVIVVDTRNTYEHSIGSFIGASLQIQNLLGISLNGQTKI